MRQISSKLEGEQDSAAPEVTKQQKSVGKITNTIFTAKLANNEEVEDAMNNPDSPNYEKYIKIWSDQKMQSIKYTIFSYSFKSF
mgnify:CR=1 FL=1